MSLEDNVQQAELRKPCIKEITADSIIFGNVSIYDSDGELVITYDGVQFDRDVQRDHNGRPLFKTPTNWIKYFEQQGKVLPPLNVTTPCLSIALDNVKDAEVMVFLNQCQGRSGWHAQNTVFHWHKSTVDVIHFPFNDDVPENYRPEDRMNIGQNQIAHRSFDSSDFGDMLVSRAIQIPEFFRFIRGANGLQYLQRQVEFGEYFCKPARVFVSRDFAQANYIGAAWLGCYGNSFLMDSCNDLSIDVAARGVHLVSAEGASVQK